MNEEEKEAIECLELVLDSESDIETEDLTNKCINNILNLIKKQQKEIEELSIIKNSIQALETHFVNDDTYYVIAKKNFLEGDFRHLLDDYISKDKIKEKIKDLKQYKEEIKEEKDFEYFTTLRIIKTLKTLLGE